MIPTPSAALVQAADGHRWQLAGCTPSQPAATLLWLPALGVGAHHYLPFAAALAKYGIATYLHEWRGIASSSVRAGRTGNWGWRKLLELDIPASADVIRHQHAGLPAIIGGHSLGGQLACCHAALAPASASRLWLVASGTPYWRAFPLPHRIGLPLVYRFLPWLAERCGALPGRRIGFGGREARGLMHDWARVGLSGNYAAAGLDIDLEARLGALQLPIQAAVMDRDWMAPEPSLRALLAKLPQAQAEIARFNSSRLGASADHFVWMKHPQRVADWLAAGL